MKGKTKLPPVEREFRDAARSILKYRELEDEFKALLGIDDSSVSAEYREELIEVSDLRMDIAKEIKDIIDAIVSTKSKDEKTKLRKSQKELMDELSNLPDIGTTFSDWEELESSGNLKRSVGRPPVPFEVNLLRSKEEADVSWEKYLKVSKESGNPASLEDSDLSHPIPIGKMIALYKEATKNMGRSSRDELGYIDSEIRKLNARIDHIVSGEEEREREEKLKKAKYSSKGTRLGRPFEPIEDVLERYKREKAALENKRSELESKLTPFERMERRIKVQEDKIRDLRKKIRAEGWDPKKDSVESMPYGEELRAMEDKVQSLRAVKAKAEKSSENIADKRAEREIKRRLIMQEELMRQHERDQESKGSTKKDSVVEGLDQLEKEIGMM